MRTQTHAIKSGRQRGFTIVELLIVIIVIGILATLVLVAYNNVNNQAKVTVLKADLAQAVKQLNLDRENNGGGTAYPASVAAANNGNGLSKSPDTMYQYTVNNSVSPATFCLTASSISLFGTSYYVSSTSQAVQTGACAGQSPTGYPNIASNSSFETAGSTWTVRTNYAKDPDATSTSYFGQSGGGPAPATVSIASDQVHGGTTSLKKVITGTGSTGTGATAQPGSTMNVPAGSWATWSMWVYSTKAGTLNMYCDGSNPSDGTYMGLSATSSNGTVPANTWTRVWGSAKAGANINLTGCGGYNMSVASGDTLWFDDFLMEKSNILDTYFSGATTNTADNSFAWGGTANASISNMNAVSASGTDMNSGPYWAKGYQSYAWAASGTRSLLLRNDGDHTDQFVNIYPMMTSLAANKTYTFYARVKTTATITDPSQIQVRYNIPGVGDTRVNSGITGAAGEYDFRFTFNTNGMSGTPLFFRLMNMVNGTGSITYWDNILVTEGNYTGAYFQ